MSTRPARSKRRQTRSRSIKATSSPAGIIDQLKQIRDADGDGELTFGGGKTLAVSNLGKLYFPDDGITKGDVMAYYVAMSRELLPLIAGRPLILKRYPDGIDGPFFFQQNAGDKVPDVVRTAPVQTERVKRATRIIGGDLPTLLYLVQIGTIAIHAWQSRISTPEFADTTTIDLDPGDGVSFSDVVTLARHVKTELDRFGLRGALKTSGSRGLHIALPLPSRTDFKTAADVARRISERVADAHPDLATVERSIRSRPRGTIYVDAQQNAAGKSVVVAYSVRERAGATISMPLEWRELRSTLKLEAFTLTSAPARIKRRGDIWGAAIAERNTKRAVDALLRS
jgi:bifunctional non-homologous end joining protein LigD